MNAFALSGLIIGISSSCIGLFVFMQDTRRRLHQVWFLFTLAVALWGFGGMGIGLTRDADASLLIWRLSFAIGVLWIPVFFLHFVYEFLELKRRRVLRFAYGINAIVATLSLTTYYYASVRGVFNEFFYAVPGSPLVLISFGWWITLFAASLFYFFNAYRRAHEHKKKQIIFTFAAIAIGAVGGTLNFLPIFGVDVYPWGNFVIPLFPAIISFAIVRHQLMDIEVIIRRATVFAGLFAFVYGVIALFTVLGQRYFATFLGWPVWTAMIPSILIITLTLRPLENWLINATDKYLFQKEYDYRELMRLFTGEVLTIFDYDQVTRNTVEALNNIIKLESCAVILKDETTHKFKMVTGFGIRETHIEFDAEDPIVHYLKQSQTHLQRDMDAKRTYGSKVLRDDFKRLNSALCIPIIFRKDLVGFLSLGAKKSGDSYNQDDIDVLMSLARTEAIAISNARLFQQLATTQAEAAQNEKMAVIGTLAAGINHEICNPLGIVRGQCEMFLLNYRDGIYGQMPDEEVIDQAVTIFGKIIKQTDRATGITKRLSNFAKPNKAFQMTEVSVADELGEVLEILEHELKLDNIQIINKLPKDYPQILADKKQLQEVIFNIVRNAAQAMQGSGTIEIGGERNGTRAKLTIADSGHGISTDKIDKIFHPFFTTKDPGKGTGLGLFIVKQIIERNEGSIAVKSEVGKGTEFTLTFRLASTLIPQVAPHV